MPDLIRARNKLKELKSCANMPLVTSEGGFVFRFYHAAKLFHQLVGLSEVGIVDVAE